MTGAPVVVATASVMSVAGVTKALGEEGAEFFRDAVQGGGEPGLGRGRHAVHRDRDVDGVARLAVGRDRNGYRCHAFLVLLGARRVAAPPDPVEVRFEFRTG